MKRSVLLEVEWMICDVPTEDDFLNDVDEVFIAVSGNVSGATFEKRFPADDDYYAWAKGQMNVWKNRDGRPLEPPRLWSGVLAPGDTADIHIWVQEQDNMSIHVELPWVTKPVIPPAVSDAGMEIQRALFAPPGDVIGRFAVAIANEGGQVIARWRPLSFCCFEPGGPLHTDYAPPLTAAHLKRFRDYDAAGPEHTRLNSQRREGATVFVHMHGTSMHPETSQYRMILNVKSA